MHELEGIIDTLRQDQAQRHEELRGYRESFHGMERAIDLKERDFISVKEQLAVTKDQLERERQQGRETTILRAAFEDECQKRQIKEREIEQLLS